MKRKMDKEQFWRKTMAEASGSGQSVRAFCRTRGLNESLFYFWRGQIKRRDAEASQREGFVELVRAVEEDRPSGVRICLGERIHIMVDREFDPASLKAVLAAVGEVVSA